MSNQNMCKLFRKIHAVREMVVFEGIDVREAEAILDHASHDPVQVAMSPLLEASVQFRSAKTSSVAKGGDRWPGHVSGLDLGMDIMIDEDLRREEPGVDPWNRWGV